mmetsp:Transcript_114097/g.322652  ORF Transcript_114097/g.322652 Transcript_114097/m.322652 type:complete len:136 (-) Transcript_114097:221-628(-)
MVFVCAPAALAFALVALVAEAASITKDGHLRRSPPMVTVKDEVVVGGVPYAIEDYANKCTDIAGASEVEVCGCGYKAVAYLLTECGSSGTVSHADYEVSVGTCDCSVSGCEKKTLTSGYTTTFEWKATSFKIVPC